MVAGRLQPPVLENELALSDAVVYTLENAVVSRCRVMLNHVFGDKINDSTPPSISPGENFSVPSRFTTTSISEASSWPGKIDYTTRVYTPRTKLELKEYGRDHIIQNFDVQRNGDIPYLSLPLLTCTEIAPPNVIAASELVGAADMLLLHCLTSLSDQRPHRTANFMPLQA
jgi:hypothetical protein